VPERLPTFQDALAAAPDGKKHVLLGNGFSRAWRDDIFAYAALLEQATFSALSPSARGAFDALGTTDFEVVMRALRAAAALAEHYATTDVDLAKRFLRDADGLREVLVQAIANNHPSRPHEVSQNEYEHARAFLLNFDRIYTVNYDLLLYWSLMQEELLPAVPCDDGFRTPDDGQAEYVTWEIDGRHAQNVFYLHGALHLFDAGHELKKYTWKNTGIPLIDQIRSALSNNLFPLFVSEGESRQKVEKIRHSDFLTRGHRSLGEIGGTLFVYGLSMSENDDHIVRRIEKNSKLTHLCVGLYGNPASKGNKAIRKRAEAIAAAREQRRGRKKELRVSFYDTTSAAVWRNA
jgi:hypothetical protein